MLSKLAILAALLGVAWMLISMMARPHWNASVSCNRVIGHDGVERDSWSFSAGYANTFLGKTIGRFKVARARKKYSGQQNMRVAAMSRETD